MDKETLAKANELNKKICELNRALECFECTYPVSDNETKTFSTNPIILIEYDNNDDGRSVQKIPAKLNKDMVGILKSFISVELECCKKEFEKL